MKKRMFCLVLSLLLVAAGTAWADTKEYVMAGFDDTQYRSWETTAFFEEMNNWSIATEETTLAPQENETAAPAGEKEETVLHFTFRVYNKSNEWKEAKAAMSKDGDIPDVLFKAGLSSSECQTMLEKGVLIDLSEMIETCCPNLNSLLQQYPEVKDAITLPDGRIAALPYIKPIGTQNYIWINEQWLKNLNLDMPADRESFTEVLRAFRDRDPNRNGKKDEIPLSLLGPFDLKFLAHVYGLKANDYNIYVEDGQVKFMPLQEEFRPFLEWCRMLWQEGLMDKESFTTTSDWREKKASASKDYALYGMMMAPLVHDVVQNDRAEEYAILMPMAYEGERVYRDFTGAAVRGTFAITSACDDPEIVLRWVDQMYDAKGYELIFFGKEGKDFRYNALGQWEMTEDARANQFFAMTRLLSGGATAPGIVNNELERKVPDDKALRIMDDQAQFAAYTQMPFPYYTLKNDQAQTVAQMQNRLGAYVDMMMGRFIIGDVELNDENYAAFINALSNEYDVEGFLAFWQQIYEAL